MVSIGTISAFPYIAEPVVLARRAGHDTVEINPGTTGRLAPGRTPCRLRARDARPELGDPARRASLFPVAGDLDMFGNVDVFVVNHLPCDPAYLREARADLRYVGAAGVRDLRFALDALPQPLFKPVELALAAWKAQRSYTPL